MTAFIRSFIPHWPPPLRLASDYIKSNANYLAIKLRLGAACPPRRTLQGWAAALKQGDVLRPLGRPTLLSGAEEDPKIFFVKSTLRDVSHVFGLQKNSPYDTLLSSKGEKWSEGLSKGFQVRIFDK